MIIYNIVVQNIDVDHEWFFFLLRTPLTTDQCRVVYMYIVLYSNIIVIIIIVTGG